MLLLQDLGMLVTLVDLDLLVLCLRDLVRAELDRLGYSLAAVLAGFLVLWWARL